MNNIFPESTYLSPSVPRSFLSKLTLNSRFYFFARACWIFMKIGHCAKRGRFNRDMQSFYSSQNVRLLEECGAKIHVTGLDFLDEAEGPFVIASNHMSSLETSVLNAMISPRVDFTFVIKNTLFKLPFFGSAMRSIHAIGIDRKNPKEDFKIILQEGRKRLLAGQSVLIFPEATRRDQFLPENFNTIAVKLAKSANVKVLPLALKTDFLGRGMLFPDFGPLDCSKNVYFEFGKPIVVEGNGRDAQQEVVNFISEKHAQWAQMQSDSEILR